MNPYVSVINQLLYFGYDSFDKILKSFGLSWVSLVTGFAVISVILRLFASNLVGTAVNVRHARQEAAAQQRIEKNKARAARGRGAATTTRKG